jgi:hypothetical protein
MLFILCSEEIVQKKVVKVFALLIWQDMKYFSYACGSEFLL